MRETLPLETQSGNTKQKTLFPWDTSMVSSRALWCISLIQNDCSPDGNRFEVSTSVVDRMMRMDEMQDEPMDLAFYAISLRLFACDKGEFYRYLPQMRLSE